MPAITINIVLEAPAIALRQTNKQDSKDGKERDKAVDICRQSDYTCVKSERNYI